jgi:hypothetical protein
VFFSFALLIKCGIQFNDIKVFFSNIGQLTAQQYRENLINLTKMEWKKLAEVLVQLDFTNLSGNRDIHKSFRQ